MAGRKTVTVKGLPGIQDYARKVQEQLFGNWAIAVGPAQNNRQRADKDWVEAMEKETVKICRKHAHSIRIRHRRGTPAYGTAADLARWHKLVPLTGIKLG